MPEPHFKIALVGEAYGAAEHITGEAFVGSAGQELNRMLRDADINRYDCWVGNVFPFKPENNDIDTLCGNKAEVLEMDPGYKWPPIKQGHYIFPHLLEHPINLRNQIAQLKPNVTVALGNTALWALTKEQPRIGKVRGTVIETPFGKVLPTYHPAAVMRQFSYRTIAVMDLIKARLESAYPEVRRTPRTIYLEPTLLDLAIFWELHLRHAEMIWFDLETIPKERQITCISLAPSPDVSLVLPFADRRRAGGSYWSSTLEEALAWKWLRMVMGSPIPKCAQNGTYDLQYLWEAKVSVRNYRDDTMLQAHALYPELPKGLDFLGSIYTNEVAWKTLRPKGSFTTGKREE